MGRRGPVPDPSSERSAKGRNTFARRGPSRPIVEVYPPAAVLEDEAALEFWEGHAPTLVADGRLRPEQAEAFAILCHLFSDMRSLAARIAKDGIIIETARTVIPHPAVKLRREARRDFVSLCRDFGLTAASEARIPHGGEDPSDDDPEGDLLDELTGQAAS